MKRIIYFLAIILAVALTGCRGAKLSVADEQMARGEYYDASKTYRKVYNKLTKKEERGKRGEVAFKMAECHRKLNQSARAVAAYQNAIRYGFADSMAQLHLAEMLHAEGKFSAAIAAYKEYLMRDPNSYVAKNGLAGSEMALENQKSKTTRYVVKNAKMFNSRRADYAPMYFDKTCDALYFTTTNEKVTGDRKTEITGMKKGDVLTVAQIAGVMGAKRTPDLIPMCHPILMDGINLELSLDEERNSVEIKATVSCDGRTGVEMEALTAVSTAALTVYDMCKAVQKDMVITDIRLLSKTGGVHGDYKREE